METLLKQKKTILSNLIPGDTALYLIFLIENFLIISGGVQDTEQLRNESIACLRAKAQQHQLQLSLQPAAAPGSTSYQTTAQPSTLHATV